jgi:tRNA G46 methylase TrmB
MTKEQLKEQQEVDPQKVEQFISKVINDLGAKVADIGCGFGATTTIMAKAYHNSTFYGFDYHAPSVESARKQAKKEALTEDRLKFEVAMPGVSKIEKIMKESGFLRFKWSSNNGFKTVLEARP